MNSFTLADCTTVEAALSQLKDDALSSRLAASTCLIA